MKAQKNATLSTVLSTGLVDKTFVGKEEQCPAPGDVTHRTGGLPTVGLPAVCVGGGGLHCRTHPQLE